MTNLSPAELRDAQAAAALIADTHVFDWNTAQARRNGSLLSVLVDALPEPQRDGATFEPYALCMGKGEAWTCELNIERALYARIKVLGSERPFAISLSDGIATAEAKAVVSQAFDMLPSVTASSECNARRVADERTFQEFRNAFTHNGSQLALLLSLEGTTLRLWSKPFAMRFERGADPDEPVFVCWSEEPVGVTS